MLFVSLIVSTLVFEQIKQYGDIETWDYNIDRGSLTD